MLTYSIILLIVFLFQITIIAMLYKQFEMLRTIPSISKIESQLNQSFQGLNKNVETLIKDEIEIFKEYLDANCSKKLESVIRNEFDDTKTKLNLTLSKEIGDSRTHTEKLLREQVSGKIVNRLNKTIKNSLTEGNLQDILTKAIEGKDESKEWEKLLDKNSDDFHLIEILTKNYAHNSEISKALYNSLLKEYKGQKNIAVKRELLKILDSLTDNMLLKTDVKNFESVKKIKIDVEELYGDLTKQMKLREYELIDEKIDSLLPLIDQVEDLNSIEAHDEYVREINEIDSSIDFNILRNDKTLFEKYNSILNELSSKIEKSKNLIIKNENSEAIKSAEKLKNDFEEATSVFNSEFDSKLIKSLVEDLALHNKHHLLPSTYEYCETIRHQIVDKLSEKQRKSYVKQTVDYSFREKIK